MKRKVDPFTMSCIAGSLETIVREMATVMEKTARSPIFKLAHDFSDTLFDADARFIVIGENEGLNHVGSMSAAAKHVADYFKGQIYPGDIIYHNDPSTGGGHLPDMAVLRPIFWKDELIAWSGNKAHMLDCGGSGNQFVKDLYGEGLRIPPIKIYEKGKIRKDVVDFLMANVRYPELQRGDLQAQMAASAIAEKRWLELNKKYGKKTVENCIEELMNVREREMRVWIGSLPDGIYKASASVEFPQANTVIDIGVTVTIQEDALHVVLSSPPQVEASINSYKGNTLAGILIALSKFGEFGRPINEGMLQPITIDYGPEGTLLNASHPAPCLLCTTTPQTSVIDMMTEALSQAVPPDRHAAGWYHVTTLASSGIHPKTKKRYSMAHLPAFAGGSGAVSYSDGYHGIGSEVAHGAMSRGNLEQTENEYPIRMLLWEMTADSPGAGKWRGGAGCTYEFEAIDHECDITITGDDKGLPLSLAGAVSTLMEPKCSKRIRKNKITGETRKIGSPAVEHLHIGETIQTWVSGGGGVGSPLERATEAVLKDVIDEIVSLEGAQEDYGVIIDSETLVIDERATELLRKQKKQSEVF